MKRIARLLILPWIFAGTLFMSGCCEEIPSTPDRPASVHGWQEFRTSQGFPALGEFVLKKGEPVENGRFGLELIKTVSPQKCKGYMAEGVPNPLATIRIYDVKTKRTLVEVEISNHSSRRLISFGFPVSEYGLDTLFAREINTKDEWVWIELWSPAGPDEN
jgi:hypothetical protein